MGIAVIVDSIMLDGNRPKVSVILYVGYRMEPRSVQQRNEALFAGLFRVIKWFWVDRRRGARLDLRPAQMRVNMIKAGGY